MQTRRLGKELTVSAMGLGCMGMTECYGACDEADAKATIHRALDLGINLLDTSDMYDIGGNEELVGRAIQGRRDKVVLATKFGNVRASTREFIGVCERPEYVRSPLRRPSKGRPAAASNARYAGRALLSIRPTL